VPAVVKKYTLAELANRKHSPKTAKNLRLLCRLLPQLAELSKAASSDATRRG
jgi:hypothetical protein